MAEQNPRRTPDERLNGLLAALDLYEGAGGAETDGSSGQQEIFATLERHQVRYVLVGGVAAILHGAPHVTTDVDVVPEEVVTELERPPRDPRELNARIRIAGEPQGVPFDHPADAVQVGSGTS